MVFTDSLCKSQLVNELPALLKHQKNPRNLLPDTLNIAYFSLHTELAFRSDFSSNLLDLICEDSQLIDHVVDGVDQAQHLS